MRACPDHPYRIASCADCDAQNLPLVPPDELLEQIVALVEGEVRA